MHYPLSAACEFGGLLSSLLFSSLRINDIKRAVVELTTKAATFDGHNGPAPPLQSGAPLLVRSALDGRDPSGPETDKWIESKDFLCAALLLHRSPISIMDDRSGQKNKQADRRL